MPLFHPHKTGLAVGALLGGFHAFWSLLVAARLAQPILDWIFGLHMIRPAYVVLPFNILTALQLVAFTAALGYFLGWLVATFWNWLAKQK